MASVASGGTADRIAARILFKVPRAGSGTPARYSSTFFGAPLPFAAELRLPDFTFFMRAMLQEAPIQVYALARRAAVRHQKCHGVFRHTCTCLESWLYFIDSSDRSEAGRVKLHRLPMSGNANAYCERLVATVRRECLDFIIPLGERHLRKLLTDRVIHYNQGRPHSSLGPRIPDPQELRPQA